MVSLQTTMSQPTSDAVTRQLRASIEASLRNSCFVQIRGLVCECHRQVMVLRGQVDSYYYKQVAQEIVKSIDPQVTIANLVTVR